MKWSKNSLRAKLHNIIRIMIYPSNNSKVGVDTMCKLMEDYADKRAKSIAVELWKDGIRDIEKIAKLTKLPLDEVKKLFEGKSA